MKKIKTKSKIQDVVGNKKIRILTSLLLFLFWIVAALLFNKQVSFSTLRYEHDVSISNKGKLLKGNTIHGEFVAKDNYLGILSLKIDNFVRLNYQLEDVLRFKIKEKGKPDWYYVNVYRTGMARDSLTFPFGFPVINDSKGKIYIFELTSLEGNVSNSIEVGNKKNLITSSHQYPRWEIAGSKSRLVVFGIRKFINSFSNFDFLIQSTTYALPLVLFLLILYTSKQPRLKKYMYLMAVLIGITLDIIFLKLMIYGVYFSLLAFLVFALRYSKNIGIVSFKITFIIVLVWTILTLLDIETFTPKLNLWAFTFLVLGLLQLLLSSKIKQRL